MTNGDRAQLLLRALPGSKGSTIPESKLLQQYGKTAENALAQEEVPPELQDSVRQYFISIGMLGKGD